ncbi:Hsp70 family protein [Deltaproteobacteria bacterium TL4]
MSKLSYSKIAGVDLSEKRTQIAVQGVTSIKLITLNYRQNDLDFSQDLALLKRLQDARKAVDDATKGRIKHAVISVPAFLTSVDYHRIIRFGNVAGWQVQRVIPNLSVAGFYSSSLKDQEDQALMVYKKEGAHLSAGLCSFADGVCEILWTRCFETMDSLETILQSSRFEYDLRTVLSINDSKDESFYKKHLLPQIPDSQQSSIQLRHHPFAPALGALLMGGVLVGEVKDLLLLENLSHSYGIEITNERNLVYCEQCWIHFSESEPEQCSQCGNTLKHETVAVLNTKYSKNKKESITILDSDLTIPYRKEILLFVETPQATKRLPLVALFTMDSSGKRLSTKRIRLPKSKKEQNPSGVFYRFVGDVDARRNVVLTIIPLPDGEVCQKSFTPKVVIPRKTKARIVEQVAVTPEIKITTMESLFGVTQPSSPKKHRKPQKGDSEDSMEQLLREIDPVLGQKEVNALLNGLAFPLPGHEDELDWWPQNDKEEKEVELKLRKLLGNVDSSYNELVQQYQKRMQEIYWIDLDELEWSDVERELKAAKDLILKEAEDKFSSGVHSVNKNTNEFESFDNLDDLDWSDVDEELKANKRDILQEANKNDE